MSSEAPNIYMTPSLPVGAIIAYIVFMLVFMILSIVIMWKLYYKAGYDGWKCLIPFYNTYIMVKIAGLPGWTFLLYFLPVIGMIFSLICLFKMGKKFGGTAMGVFYLIPLVGIFAMAYCAFSYNIEYAFED